MPAFANVTAELTEVYLMTAVGMDVTLGVDTHKDTHVGAVLDNLGRCLAVSEFKADVSGSRRLLAWASGYGFVRSAGVEGTGSYGYRVAQFLTHSGVSVFEVSRPDRSTRRRKGKSDSVDAESAARAVLAGEATAVPKDREGPVGALRAIVVARRSAVKARTQAFNQIHALLVGCDDRLRTKAERSRPLTLASGCSRLRPTNGSRLALRSLGRRWLYLNNEVAALDAEIGAIVRRVAPRLLQRHSVGVQTAAQLLVTAGDNADRIRTEAALAALCGTSPVEASSGARASGIG